MNYQPDPYADYEALEELDLFRIVAVFDAEAFLDAMLGEDSWDADPEA